MNPQGIFETDRLVVRTWSAADASPLQEICADSEVMQFVADGRPWQEEKTRQFIARAIEMNASHGYCQWALGEKCNGKLIGFCGFIPAEGGAEIGWRLARESWGQGLATEAARAVLNYGFTTLGFQRVTATVQSRNRDSIRVAEKIGMVVDGTILRDGRQLLVFAK